MKSNVIIVLDEHTCQDEEMNFNSHILFFFPPSTSDNKFITGKDVLSVLYVTHRIQ